VKLQKNWGVEREIGGLGRKIGGAGRKTLV